MAVNRGKQFEEIIRASFLAVPNVSVDRLADPTSGYLGIRNVSDFIVYKNPNQYYIECKSVHGNTMPFSNITKNQWDGMLEKSKIDGVYAGVIVWFIDHDKTWYIDIQWLEYARKYNQKSVNVVKPWSGLEWLAIHGEKKRIFFDYDMGQFFDDIKFLHSM